jgi:hypothetical protein
MGSKSEMLKQVQHDMEREPDFGKCIFMSKKIIKSRDVMR